MKIIAILALICLATAMTISRPKEDIVHDAEEFLEGFWGKAFDTTLDLETCEGDASSAL